MIGFVLKRVAGLAVTLFFAAFLIFMVLDLAQGETDAPIWQRFTFWIGGALLGDFGASADGPIGILIAERLSVTLPLATLAMLLAAAVGVPLGVLAALKPATQVDRIVMGGALFAGSLPAFWVGMLLVLVFSAALHWLPSGGFVPWLQDPAAAITSLLLPAFTLALPLAAVLARAARNALMETQASAFIRTERIKGMTLAQALWQHGLRNSALPVLAFARPQFALSLAGAIVVENVFYLPGLGRLIFAAVADGDTPVIRAALLALLAAMTAALLIADLLRAWADPRLRQRSVA